MSKPLVAFFSASGVTRKLAEFIADAATADLFEIIPKDLYTAADLDWTNKQSRSTLEMQDLNCRPEIVNKVSNLNEYDTILLGFPVWWGREPSVVDTFLDENDLSGKKVIPFCTSGGSDISGSTAHIRELLGDKAVVEDGSRLAGDISNDDLKIWEAGLNL